MDIGLKMHGSIGVRRCFKVGGQTTLIWIINNKNILCTSLKSGGHGPPGEHAYARVMDACRLRHAHIMLE